MKTLNRSKRLLAATISVLTFLSLADCIPAVQTPTPIPIQTHNQKLVRANTVLTTVGTFAEGSFYACLLDAYLQGLRTDQMSDQCATKLLEDNDKGFGDGPFGDVGHQEMFDPGKITAACSSGDPTIAGSYGEARKSGYGFYSWGGNSNDYYQLSKEQSEKQKDAAIKEANEAADAWLEAVKEQHAADTKVKEAEKSGDPDKIKKAKEEQEAADKKAQDASKKADETREKAKQDPNKKPVNSSHPAQNSPCQEALNEARELLRECHRTGWKDFRCQQLQAKMNHCPDPAQILVDPEQGYTCGFKLDAATLDALKDAWVASCEELKRPVPGGPNPCEPPEFDESQRTGHGKIGDVCNDPAAYIDPDNNDCVATFTIKPPFGEPNLQQIAVWGLNKLGGPIIVLPPRGTDTPSPGPQPRPSP